MLNFNNKEMEYITVAMGMELRISRRKGIKSES